jgi:O-antigen ligase
MKFLRTTNNANSPTATKTTPTSWATILPVIWLVINNSKGFLFWKGTLDPAEINQSQIEGSGFDRLVLSALLIIAFYVFYSRRDRIIPIFIKNFWLFAFLGYMVLSAFWSDFPFIAFKRWVRVFGTVVMIMLLATENDPLQAGVKVLKQACFFVLPVSLVFIFALPSIGTVFSPDNGLVYWCGIATHKNMLGQWATIGMLLFLWLLFDPAATLKNRSVYFCMLALSWLLLIGCKSTTSLSISLVGIGVFTGFIFAKKTGKYGFIIVFLSATSLLFSALLATQLFLKTTFISSLLNLAGKDSTLTGRTDLWNHLIAIGSQKMWFGHGYGTFWISKLGDHTRAVLGWGMYSAHNGALDLFLQLGVVGLIFLFIYIVFALRGVFSVYCHDFRYGMLWVTFLIITLFSNYSESNFGVMAHQFWFLSLLVSFNIPKKFLKKKDVSYA